MAGSAGGAGRRRQRGRGIPPGVGCDGRRHRRLSRRCAVEPWPEGAELRVRMAVHTGEAQLRDEGNYVGQTLNRGARLRAIGTGVRCCCRRRPRRWSPIDCRAGPAGRPGVAPSQGSGATRARVAGGPPGSGRSSRRCARWTRPHNLPVQLTPLVGRREENGRGGWPAGGRAVGDPDRFGGGGRDPLWRLPSPPIARRPPRWCLVG